MIWPQTWTLEGCDVFFSVFRCNGLWWAQCCCLQAGEQKHTDTAVISHRRQRCTAFKQHVSIPVGLNDTTFITGHHQDFTLKVWALLPVRSCWSDMKTWWLCAGTAADTTMVSSKLQSQVEVCGGFWFSSGWSRHSQVVEAAQQFVAVLWNLLIPLFFICHQSWTRWSGDQVWSYTQSVLWLSSQSGSVVVTVEAFAGVAALWRWRRCSGSTGESPGPDWDTLPSPRSPPGSHLPPPAARRTTSECCCPPCPPHTHLQYRTYVGVLLTHSNTLY